VNGKQDSVCDSPKHDLNVRISAVLNSAVGRVRLAGLIEAVSFLVLLLVAMPLKYLAGKPEAVLYVGWAHGVLFIAYATVTFIAWSGGQLTAKLVGMAAIASLVPCGPFMIDRRLKAVERSEKVEPVQ
jgi:integral membrane protein